MEVWDMYYGNMEYALWKYGVCIMGMWEYALWEYGVCIRRIWSMYLCEYGHLQYVVWEYHWGEPERAPHQRDCIVHACIYIHVSIYGPTTYRKF